MLAVLIIGVFLLVAVGVPVVISRFIDKQIEREIKRDWIIDGAKERAYRRK